MKKKSCRYQIVRAGSGHVGFYNPCTKMRLKNLLPNKRVMVKQKATAYEEGYAHRQSTDLHEEMAGRQTVSPEEYKELCKRYKQER